MSSSMATWLETEYNPNDECPIIASLFLPSNLHNKVTIFGWFKDIGRSLTKTYKHEETTNSTFSPRPYSIKIISSCIF